jgi:hypothetical protein
MEGSATGRVALFLAASALLVLASIAFSRGSGSIGTAEPPRNGSRAAGIRGAEQALIDQLEQEKAEVEVASRRFLGAFLRYEVGDLTPTVRRRLRTTATPGFARRLFNSPARPTVGRFPPRAVLRRLDVQFVSPKATLARVNGTAWRAGLPEEFAFLFTLRPVGWLASGPAE